MPAETEENSQAGDPANYRSVSTQLSDETTESGQVVMPHTVKKPVIDGAAGQPSDVNSSPSIAVTTPGGNGLPDVESRKIAQASTAATPVAMVSSGAGRTWQIILIPMFASMVIFLLLWSVFNGWFERLIY